LAENLLTVYSSLPEVYTADNENDYKWRAM
jgi:hypothetical protein